MILLGISGKKGSGKSTVSRLIDEHYTGVVNVVNFADALKEEVTKACSISIEELENNKAHYRTILQWWGTEFRRYQDTQYWVKKWFNKVSVLANDTLIVTADVRFLNEVACFRLGRKDDILWRVERLSLQDTQTDYHTSETEMDNFKDFDEVIHNDGSLTDLSIKVKAMVDKYLEPLRTT